MKQIPLPTKKQVVFTRWQRLRLTLWLNIFLLAIFAIAIASTRNLNTSLVGVLAFIVSCVGVFIAARISLYLTNTVTEREQAEKALRESEERYRRLVEYSPNGILIHQDATFVFANRAVAHLFGVDDPNMLINKPILEYIHPDHHQSTLERGRREIILVNGQYPITEEHLKRVDGTDVFVETARIPFVYKGKPATQVILRDITERKLAEAAVQRANLELEQRVEERTAELAQTNTELEAAITRQQQLEAQITQSLARRTHQVEIATEVAQEIAAAPVLDELFERVVNLVQQRLGYYHAHVYTLEDGFLVMQKGTGVPGRKMRETHHQIPLSARSLVTHVATEGTAVLVPDVANEPHHLPNPLLPDTRSEIAAAIKLDNEVLGVLDVQSNQKGGLTEEDKLLLMGLCGQIAVAINNRRLATEWRQAREQLRAYTVELERSNRALQEFAYVASHDLQEPLRKVQAFGNRLATKYEDQLDERGIDYLNRMQNAAARMQILINDLLAYSRITTKARPFKPVDLNKIVADVIIDLEVKIEQLAATIHCDSLPTIDADATQIRQLMQNVIGNALKFHRPNIPPIVTITSQLLTVPPTTHETGPPVPTCSLSITDNGIGLDENLTDRIFQVFQRLHNRHEYEGTGVGLAICRKIVERHGGEITATSKLDDGTTFTITLPIKQTENA